MGELDPTVEANQAGHVEAHEHLHEAHNRYVSKGALVVGAGGAGEIVALLPGPDGRVLITDSSSPSGLAWAVPSGGGASGGSYAHTQSVPSASWSINHGLGYRPSVTAVDSAGNELIPDVSYPSVNEVSLSWGAPFSGFAYLS